MLVSSGTQRDNIKSYLYLNWAKNKVYSFASEHFLKAHAFARWREMAQARTGLKFF
jgi:hypothetical protein